MDIKKYLIIPLFCFLSSCGGSSNTDSSENNQVSSGVVPNAFGKLIDSEVIGLKYKSGEYEGITDENGVFGYILGEQIQFFVGDISIGYQVDPKDILTPYELSNNNSYVALNVARFLQSLDDDMVLSNGIQIHDSIHALAKGKTLDFLSNEWTEKSVDISSIEQLIYFITSQTFIGSRYSVTPFDAYKHYEITLNDFMGAISNKIINEVDISGCTQDSECKSFTLEPNFIYPCPPPADEYIYSEVTTNIDDINLLKEERNVIFDTKREIASAAGLLDNISGSCFYSPNIQWLSCNQQSECEFTESIPIVLP